MNEPSVLDYVKSKIFFWRGEVIQIPGAEEAFGAGQVVEIEPAARPDELLAEFAAPVKRRTLFQPGALSSIARILLILILAIIAQRALEPPGRSSLVGILFYLLAAVWLVWANLRGEWEIAAQPQTESSADPLTFHPMGLWVSIPLLILAFVMFGNNHFSVSNLTIWLLDTITRLWCQRCHVSTLTQSSRWQRRHRDDGAGWETRCS